MYDIEKYMKQIHEGIFLQTGRLLKSTLEYVKISGNWERKVKDQL